MKRLLPLFLIVACNTSKPPAQLNQSQIPKLDIHAHYSYPRSYLPALLDDWNMRAMVVEVIHVDDELRRNRWPAMKAHFAEEPERLLLASSFDATLIDEPDFADGVIDQLRDDIAAGARMVKVWKEVGMVIKDASGTYIQIDDERFQPIWDFLIEQNIPMLAHIGEPRAAWLPLDESSPHYNYYKNNPQYHAYQTPEVPSWETIMAARDRWLQNNPNLTVIGAHIGSMAYDVEEVARRLDRYPNFYAGTAARFGDLAKQPSDKVRDFFIRYQDRLLYGTDLSTRVVEDDRSADALQNEREALERRFTMHWTYLAGSDSLNFSDYGTSYDAPTKGLALPDSVLRKFYAGNAERVLGR